MVEDLLHSDPDRGADAEPQTRFLPVANALGITLLLIYRSLCTFRKFYRDGPQGQGGC